jgi:hypothetical protein
MAITGPIYWNGTTFPSQGGDPVEISEAEFEDCCCDPCEDCNGTQPSPIVTGDPCVPSSVTDTTYLYISYGWSSAQCTWLWRNDDYDLRVVHVHATSEYQVRIDGQGGAPGTYVEDDADLSCLSGITTGSATLVDASDPACFAYVTLG